MASLLDALKGGKNVLKKKGDKKEAEAGAAGGNPLLAAIKGGTANLKKVEVKETDKEEKAETKTDSPLQAALKG
jgi:hypothetical protein